MGKKIKQVYIEKDKNKILLKEQYVDENTAIVEMMYNGLSLIFDSKRYSNVGLKRYSKKWGF
jgi:hypothetical protein